MVIAGVLGLQQLIVYDVTTGQQTRVAGRTLALEELVTRGTGDDLELWLVHDQGLHELGVMSATLTTVTLGWEPEHINVLPIRDQLVLDDSGAARLVFWSPASRQIVRAAALPL